MAPARARLLVFAVAACAAATHQDDACPGEAGSCSAAPPEDQISLLSVASQVQARAGRAKAPRAGAAAEAASGAAPAVHQQPHAAPKATEAAAAAQAAHARAPVGVAALALRAPTATEWAVGILVMSVILAGSVTIAYAVGRREGAAAKEGLLAHPSWSPAGYAACGDAGITCERPPAGSEDYDVKFLFSLLDAAGKVRALSDLDASSDSCSEVPRAHISEEEPESEATTSPSQSPRATAQLRGQPRASRRSRNSRRSAAAPKTRLPQQPLPKPGVISVV